MAIKGLYNADGTTTYSVSDVKLLHNKFISGKVIYGKSDLIVAAQTTPEMSIKVSSGLCSINGAFLQNTASYTIPVANNSASYPRIDCVVAYISGTTYSLRVIQGTASSNPVPPTVSSSVYVKLAEITVGVGVTSIQASNIKDCREENNQIIITSLIDEINNIKSKTIVLEDSKIEVIKEPSGPEGVIFQKIDGKNYGILEVFRADTITASSTSYSNSITLSLGDHAFTELERCSYSLQVVPVNNLGHNYWQGVNGNFARAIWLNTSNSVVIVIHGLTVGQKYILKWGIRGFGR
ncbi:MAG: hypothetical protein J6D47_19145 [Peptostreptococcaceae bacterium]|nr:hypothetical protein [Peptostreptococcaceae bacterium]